MYVYISIWLSFLLVTSMIIHDDIPLGYSFYLLHCFQFNLNFGKKNRYFSCKDGSLIILTPLCAFAVTFFKIRGCLTISSHFLSCVKIIIMTLFGQENMLAELITAANLSCHNRLEGYLARQISTYISGFWLLWWLYLSFLYFSLVMDIVHHFDKLNIGSMTKSLRFSSMEVGMNLPLIPCVVAHIFIAICWYRICWFN